MYMHIWEKNNNESMKKNNILIELFCVLCDSINMKIKNNNNFLIDIGRYIGSFSYVLSVKLFFILVSSTHVRCNVCLILYQ